MGELLVSLFVVVSIFLYIFLGKIFIHDILEVNGVNIFLLTGFWLIFQLQFVVLFVKAYEFSFQSDYCICVVIIYIRVFVFFS